MLQQSRHSSDEEASRLCSKRGLPPSPSRKEKGDTTGNPHRVPRRQNRHDFRSDTPIFVMSKFESTDHEHVMTASRESRQTICLLVAARQSTPDTQADCELRSTGGHRPCGTHPVKMFLTHGRVERKRKFIIPPQCFANSMLRRQKQGSQLAATLGLFQWPTMAAFEFFQHVICLVFTQS
jgi:hypothetical protein